MECYDCGSGIAAGVEKCPSCGCPTEKGKAVLCLRARLLSTEIESASALVRLGWARNAMFTAALLAAASGVIELANASGNGVRLMVGVVMFILAAGYAAVACTIRRAPLALSVVGLVTGVFFMNGVFGVVIIGVMAMSVWFAIQYTNAIKRERELRMKIGKLK